MEFPITRPLENHQHHLPWPDHRRLQPPTVSSPGGTALHAPSHWWGTLAEIPPLPFLAQPSSCFSCSPVALKGQPWTCYSTCCLAAAPPQNPKPCGHAWLSGILCCKSLSAWPAPTCSFSQGRRKKEAFVCTFLISVHSRMSLGDALSPSPVLLLLHPRRHAQHRLRSSQGLAPCLQSAAGRSPCWGGSGWSQLGCPHQKPLPGHQPACPARSCVAAGARMSPRLSLAACAAGAGGAGTRLPEAAHPLMQEVG